MKKPQTGLPTRVNELEGLLQETQEPLHSLEGDDNFVLDVAEPESEFELREGEESTEDKKEQLIPYQWFLPEVYLKDIAREALLTQKQEAELSSTIKECEARVKEIKAALNKSLKKEVSGKSPAQRVKRLNTLMRAYSEKAKKTRERFIKAKYK